MTSRENMATEVQLSDLPADALVPVLARLAPRDRIELELLGPADAERAATLLEQQPDVSSLLRPVDRGEAADSPRVVAVLEGRAAAEREHAPYSTIGDRVAPTCPES